MKINGEYMVVWNEIIKEVFWYFVYLESYESLTNFKKKVIKSTFFKPWSAGNQNSITFKKTDKVNKHIPVLDIAKNKSAFISGIAEIRPWKSVMWSESHSK